MGCGVIDDGLDAGSMWNHRFRSFRVRIALPSRVFIYCVREDNREHMRVPRALFRDRFVRHRDVDSPEVRLLKSRFSMSLANLEHMHAFIEPESKRLIVRSADRSPEDSREPRRGSPRIPEKALYVGTYARPASPFLFLEDLEALFAQLARGQLAGATG